MKLLGDAVLHDHYDVVVVGAGLGGMAAASRLADGNECLSALERDIAGLLSDRIHFTGSWKAPSGSDF
jgi:choline dehydrogenase-like flavoprotein